MNLREKQEDQQAVNLGSCLEEEAGADEEKGKTCLLQWRWASTVQQQKGSTVWGSRDSEREGGSQVCVHLKKGKEVIYDLPS